MIMEESVGSTFNLLDNLTIKYYNSLYTLSIAKEAVAGKESNGGIVIIGMIIVIVGLVGFILTKNKS
jgi:hypothetical protein